MGTELDTLINNFVLEKNKQNKKLNLDYKTENLIKNKFLRIIFRSHNNTGEKSVKKS